MKLLLRFGAKIFFLSFIILTLCLPVTTLAADLRESEPNNSAAQANAVAFGSTIAGDITWDVNNREDWFKVQATGQGAIEFEIKLSEFSIENGNSFYVSAYYQHTDGTISPYYTDYNLSPHSGGVYKTHKIRVQAGTYYLRLYTNGSRQTLDYEIKPIFTPEGSGYEKEFNNTKETANEISVNTPVTGNISGPYDDDYFRVEAPDDGIMQLKIEADTAIYYYFGVSSPNAATQAQVSLGSFKTENFVSFRYGKEIKASAGDIYYIWVGNANVPSTCRDDYTITMLFTDESGNSTEPGTGLPDPGPKDPEPEPAPDPDPNPGVPNPGGEELNGYKGEAITVGAKLWWNPKGGGVGYRLYRSELPGEEGISITDFYITSNEFVDVNVDANKTYYYTLRQVIAEAKPFEEQKELLGPASEQIRLTMPSTLVGGDASDSEKEKQFILMTMDSPVMNVNGYDKEIDPGRGTTPLILNSRTMVPIRAIIEEMGGTVSWDDSTRQITLSYDGKTVFMWLNNREIQVNGASESIDVPPASINSRTMVPIRFATENLGQSVEWINSERKIVIVYQ